MKVLSYRTTMPFEDGLSPTTPKSVVPTNNVHTIQDVLDGKKYVLPGGGGDWSSDREEDVSKSYREEGDDYKRLERDFDIVRNMLPVESIIQEKWKVKVPGGSRVFPSFEMAQKYKEMLKDKGIQYAYLARVAQNNLNNLTDKTKIIAEALEKTFMVESIDMVEGVKENGAAFCVAPGYFVTCAHVIQKYNKQKVLEMRNSPPNVVVNLVQRENRFRAKVVKIDYKLDIAIIKADVNIPSFIIDTSPIPIGEDIVSIGSPHGYENNVSTGTLGSVDRKIYFYKGAPRYMFVDLSILPGNSGGPVISQSTGAVIGMVTLIVSGKSGGYGLNAALEARYINSFCKKYIPRY